MSSAEELLLPGELDKLEIAPILPQVKQFDSNLPLSLNPFYDVSAAAAAATAAEEFAAAASTSINTTATKQITCLLPPPLNCRKCRRQRHCSESVLDEYRAAATHAATLSTHEQSHSSSLTATTQRSCTPGVQRTSLKKSATSTAYARGKKLLRAPILRALQTCILHQQTQSDVVRRKLESTADSSQTPQTLQARVLGGDGAIASGGISDFRDLINECQTLLASEVVSGGSGGGFKKKNFTTLRGGCQTANAAVAIADESLKNANLAHSSIIDASASSSINNDVSNNVSQTPLHAGGGGARTAANTSTSCSQQAGGAPTTTDDVTIDELASYFDTLVHIPKKMSSMAEMMYI